MIIEKSPHHNFYNKIINSDKKNQADNSEFSKESFKFWEWIKGAVSPLQNLPVISGIYSSINSEDKSSDRDLVQSSAGGFIYGGPIGAMVGAGSWIFNKIFDKTPAEMALDVSGISKFWKETESVTRVAESSVEDVIMNEKSISNTSKNLEEFKKFVDLNNIKYPLVKNNIDKENSDKLIQVKRKEVDKILIKPKGMNLEYPKWTPNLENNMEIKNEIKKNSQFLKPNAMYKSQLSLDPNKNLFDIRA